MKYIFMKTTIVFSSESVYIIIFQKYKMYLLKIYNLCSYLLRKLQLTTKGLFESPLYSCLLHLCISVYIIHESEL